jgi:hypothetical protein
MAAEKVDLIFGGDPSGAVNAAKKVTEETNKVGQSGKLASESFLQISSEVSQIRNRVGKVTLAVTALATAAYALVRPFKRHVEEAEKLSRAIETSYENAQELAIAEREAGLAAGSIRSAIEGIAMAQAQGIVSPDLLNLGFTFEEIKEQKPDELFDTLSKRLGEGKLTAIQFEAAVNTLGQNGSEVALKLAGNFEDFREVAKDSGRIIKEETFAELISESDLFIAQIEEMGESIVKASTPFESFGELVVGVFRGINEQLENLIWGVKYVVNFYGGLLGGLSKSEAAEFGIMEAFEGTERARTRAERTNAARAATENLTEERAAGAVDFLDFLRGRVDSGESDISSLQRVGLAATGGEAEGIRLQRRQLTKADGILNQLIKQTNVIQTQL